MKTFGKHAMLQYTKGKHEQNVLESMAIRPANALEREGMGYYDSFQLSPY